MSKKVKSYTDKTCLVSVLTRNEALKVADYYEDELIRAVALAGGTVIHVEDVTELIHE